MSVASSKVWNWSLVKWCQCACLLAWLLRQTRGEWSCYYGSDRRWRCCSRYSCWVVGL